MRLRPACGAEAPIALIEPEKKYCKVRRRLKLADGTAKCEACTQKHKKREYAIEETLAIQ